MLMLRSVLNKAFLHEIWDFFSNFVVFFVMLIALLLLGLRVCGYNFYTVMSGSMEPALGVGSLVFVQPVEASTLRDGDVISYITAGNNIVTHRINTTVTEYDDNGAKTIHYITKGDANNSVDGGTVDPRNVIGKVMISIPLLGYPVYSIQQPPFIYFALVSGALLLVSVFVPRVEKKERRELLTG